MGACACSEDRKDPSALVLWNKRYLNVDELYDLDAEKECLPDAKNSAELNYTLKSSHLSVLFTHYYAQLGGNVEGQ